MCNPKLNVHALRWQQQHFSIKKSKTISLSTLTHYHTSQFIKTQKKWPLKRLEEKHASITDFLFYPTTFSTTYDTNSNIQMVVII